MRRTLSVLLTGAITEVASAAKVAIPTPGAPDVLLGIPSEKILWGILFGNAVALVVYLWKSIRDTEKEDLREIKKALASLPTLTHKIERLDDHIKQLPTRETVEVMIWKHLKEHK